MFIPDIVLDVQQKSIHQHASNEPWRSDILLLSQITQLLDSIMSPKLTNLKSYWIHLLAVRLNILRIILLLTKVYEAYLCGVL